MTSVVVAAADAAAGVVAVGFVEAGMYCCVAGRRFELSQ